MSSFAFWCKENNGYNNDEVPEKELFAEVHFNLWLECEFNDKPFLDVGLMVNELKQTERLFFYIPFEITKSDLEDLGSKLRDDKVLNAIFNENYSIKNHATTKHSQISDCVSNEETPVFDLYYLDIESDIKFSNRFCGTILEFDSKMITDAESSDIGKYYLRFRIKTDKIKDFINVYEPKNRPFETQFSVTHIIDFRFNDNRSLNPSLIERMNGGDYKKICVNKLHFLLLTKANVDILTDGFSSARELEKNIWDDYAGGKVIEDIVAYHWAKKVEKEKGKKDIDSWVLFAKIKSSKCTWGTIIKYILIAGVLSLCINLCSNYIWYQLVEK